MRQRMMPTVIRRRSLIIGSAVLVAAGLTLCATPYVASASPVAAAAATDNPIGHLDTVTLGGEVRGWAFDPNSAAPIAIDFYVDGALTAETSAPGQRTDVVAVYGRTAVGFDTFVPMKPGVHTVCAYGRNVGPGTNDLIGCRTATIDPRVFGRLDFAIDYTWHNNPQVMVAGWAIDPAIAPGWLNAPDVGFLNLTKGLLPLTITIDGATADNTTTRWLRQDVQEAYPDFGPYSGVMEVLDTTAGPHTVCLTVPRTGSASVTIGCTTVDIGMS